MPMAIIFTAGSRVYFTGKDLTTVFTSIKTRWTVRGTASSRSGNGNGIAGIAECGKQEARN
jgi:hypothetical protein